jgi:hypothetical protein
VGAGMDMGVIGGCVWVSINDFKLQKCVRKRASTHMYVYPFHQGTQRERETHTHAHTFCPTYLQDGDMGVLDEDVAARARGSADIAAFGNVLQEFLDEQVGGCAWVQVHVSIRYVSLISLPSSL